MKIGSTEKKKTEKKEKKAERKKAGGKRKREKRREGKRREGKRKEKRKEKRKKGRKERKKVFFCMAVSEAGAHACFPQTGYVLCHYANLTAKYYLAVASCNKKVKSDFSCFAQLLW